MCALIATAAQLKQFLKQAIIAKSKIKSFHLARLGNCFMKTHAFYNKPPLYVRLNYTETFVV